MKYALYLLLLAPLAMLAKSYEAVARPNTYFTTMWVLPYSIVSSEKDPALDNQHARFEIQFNDDILNGKTLAEQTITVEFSCNGVIERFQLNSTMKTTVDVSPGSYTFQFTALGNNGYQEVTTEAIVIKPGFKTVLSVSIYPVYQADPNRPVEMIVYKPVIYLYPETDLAVGVQLQPKGEFTFTYPAYEHGWNGIAHPDGSISINGKTYPYLFWEGKHQHPEQLQDYTTGFVVQQDEVIAFLEEKLTEMNFNDQEKTDFITFWGPRMAASEKGFAHFLFTEAYDDLATLDIQPAPESVFRVYVLWTPLDAGTTLHPKPQRIERLNRTGFYALEWGGSELPLPKQLTSK